MHNGTFLPTKVKLAHFGAQETLVPHKLVDVDRFKSQTVCIQGLVSERMCHFMQVVVHICVQPPTIVRLQAAVCSTWGSQATTNASLFILERGMCPHFCKFPVI